MCGFEEVWEAPFFERVIYNIDNCGVTRMSALSLSGEDGIGSRLYDLVGEEFRNLKMLPSDTGSKEGRALLLFLGLVRKKALMTVVQL